MGYKILGFTVWHGAKWYVRRRANQAWETVPVKPVVLGLGVAAIVGGLVFRGVRQG